jgi:hypothetical protein
MKTRQARKAIGRRRILSVKPRFTLSLIEADLKVRSRQKGALRRLIEEAVYTYIGPKHPKLMAEINAKRLFGQEE